MKVLITGGLGFIGSNFIRYYLSRHPDDRVINLDVHSYAANPDNLRDVEKNPRYALVKGDISDPETVARTISECQGVINFAAESHVDRSIANAAPFVQTNVLGTQVLLEASRRRRIERFLHVSTDEVYGSIERGSFLETSPLSPNSPYAASKAAADLLVRSYHVTHRIPALVTRSSNNFGPYQHVEKLIPLFVTNALDDRPLPLYGDGLNVRDWLYVLDNCRAIDLVFQSGRPGEIYNVGGGNELTNIELTRLILDLLQKPAGLIRPVQDRPGHDRRYSIDCGKIARELGWRPEYDFRRALVETIDWYRRNRGWWETAKK